MFVSKCGRYHWARVSAISQSLSPGRSMELLGGGARRAFMMDLKPSISGSVERR